MCNTTRNMYICASRALSVTKNPADVQGKAYLEYKVCNRICNMKCDVQYNAKYVYMCLASLKRDVESRGSADC